ncbi:ATP-binding protein [Streptomyces sp. ISL-112]|uniref:ATP-binding protein n=1 Tax=unclassified Streptomyces TaxID=2593676 RepID=UPI001BECD8AE|nr:MULTISPECIES: ATP-binding protein [unclassified Streptomyces]MBT2427243.1 ATP-binding protein [Streptomyces sp. ISL-112]MBT2465733.1 ATP-binding protein [Streptomyces sp. ISL-63]
MTEQRRGGSPCCTSPSGPPAQAVFPADPEAARHARRYVREVLAHDDERRMTDDRLDDVLLIVSELVTNAYRYGTEPGDAVVVTVLTTTETVRIEVDDPRRRRPHLRDESEERGRGRGLHIVDALAARWDVADRPFGKKVWAEVAR